MVGQSADGDADESVRDGQPGAVVVSDQGAVLGRGSVIIGAVS